MENRELKDKGKGRAVDYDVVPSPVKKKTRTDSPLYFDLLTFARSLEDAFQNKRREYDLFYKIVSDFRTKDRTSTIEEVIGEVEVLFKGHEELLVQFNDILVQYYGDDTDTAPLEVLESLGFLSKLKERYVDEPTKQNTFQSIMASFKSGTASPSETYNAGAKLFEGQHDLLEEFKKFFPYAKERKV